MKKNKGKVTYDIEEYRKKKQREKVLHRLIRILIIFVLLVGVGGGVYFYQQYDLGNYMYQTSNPSNSSQDMTVETGSFPISLDAVTPLQLESFRKGTILMTDEELLVVNSDGTVSNQFVHSFTNPVLHTGHDEFLLYDRGGYGYRMENYQGSLVSSRTTATIQTGACGYQQHFALVTSESHYASSVTVYDKTGENILTWYSLEPVVDISFSLNDRYLAVASVVFENDGTMISRIHMLDIEKEQEIGAVDYSDAMPVAVHIKEDGQIHLVTDSFLGVISADLSEQRKVPYLQQLQLYQFSDNETLLINSGASEVSSSVSIVSASGEKKEQTVDSAILDSSLDSDGLCLLTGNGVIWYSNQMEQLGVCTISNEVFQISRNGDYLYTMTPSLLDKQSLTNKPESSLEEEDNS